MGVRGTIVGWRTIVIFSPCSHRLKKIKLSQELSEKVRGFDETGKMRPFKFVIFGKRAFVFSWFNLLGGEEYEK